jgi:hypothetical protein
MHGDPAVRNAGCRLGHPITANCPVGCLAPLLPSRVFRRLARAEGRHGEPMASCGPLVTVGDVVRLYRQGWLGEIAGLGARSITKIEAGLVFAGLLLDSSTPARRQPRARRTTTPASAASAATTATTKLSAGPGRSRIPWRTYRAPGWIGWCCLAFLSMVWAALTVGNAVQLAYSRGEVSSGWLPAVSAGLATSVTAWLLVARYRGRRWVSALLLGTVLVWGVGSVFYGMPQKITTAFEAAVIALLTPLDIALLAFLIRVLLNGPARKPHHCHHH